MNNPPVNITHLKMLLDARALISDSRRWTQWALARDIDDRESPPTAEKAVKWCALGAIHYVTKEPIRMNVLTKDYPRSQFNAYVGSFGNDRPEAYAQWDRVAVWNDQGTHGQILQLFDMVIEQLRTDLTRFGILLLPP